jgi:cation transport ATPase
MRRSGVLRELLLLIAVTGGMSRASRAGVVVKDGAALELLGRAGVLAMDKTGTVTEGRPEVVDVVCAPGIDTEDALAVAAGVEQYSPHVPATAVVRAAERAGVDPLPATEVVEEPGHSASGLVGGVRVRVGRLSADTVPPGYDETSSRSR